MNYLFLQEVGIIEIDETLRKCNPALRQAEELTTAYREAIHDFKRVSKNIFGSLYRFLNTKI